MTKPHGESCRCSECCEWAFAALEIARMVTKNQAAEIARLRTRESQYIVELAKMVGRVKIDKP